MKRSRPLPPDCLRCSRESCGPAHRRPRMNLRAFCILVLLCVSACCVASGGPQAADPSRSASSTGHAYDLASFSAELSRLDQILQAKPSPEKIAEFRRELPASWEVPPRPEFFSFPPNPRKRKCPGPPP